MYKAKDSSVYVGRSSGLYQLINNKQVEVTYLKQNAVHSIAQDKEGNFYFGTDSKILKYSFGKLGKEIIPKYQKNTNTFMFGGDKSVNKLVVDDYSRIWFSSYPDENLYLYDKENTYNIFELNNFTPSLINCVFKDNKQNIWIGTFDNAAMMLQNTFFNSINFEFKNKALNVNQVCFKNNILIAATSNGLFGLNVNTNETKILSKPDEIINEHINGIVEDNDLVYFLKKSQFNQSSGNIFSDGKHLYSLKPVLAEKLIFLNKSESVLTDRFANVLRCSADLKRVIDTLISFPDYRINVNDIISFNKRLYVATSNGLFEYDFSTKKYQNINKSQLNYKINDLAIIGNNFYAAHESGLTEVNSSKLIQKVGKLNLNGIKKIKIFENKVWLATLNGVIVCDTLFNPLFVINKGNGLPSNTVNDIAFSNNSICISTARGISIALLSDLLKLQTALPAVLLNYITIDGAITPHQNTYTLTTNQNDISISIISPFFNKNNKQYFRYRKNLSEWVYFETFAFSVGGLTSGNTTVEIQTSIDQINWSVPLQINFSKEKAATESSWLYVLISLFLILVIIGISFIINKNTKRKALRRLQQEQQINVLKHQAMNALLSPHFIFNSLTSIQNYINSNNSLKASEYLAKFSRLIRMIIERASQSEISIADELTRLTYYLELEKERFKNKFDFYITVDETINKHETKIPNMIIQPHVENSIIHGILPKLEHGDLYISFKKTTSTKLEIKIEDNGIGLIKAREHAKTGHKSLGTSTIKNILEINSKLYNRQQMVSMIDKSENNNNETGTIILIEIEIA
ncbi:MAG: histidine kinase [Bacteroidetes bacterium]|nr:histidine kinase [Bacteroidota bacterium]